MHALSLELAETSDAIARTMAEAATANFFTDPASTATSTGLPDAEGDEGAVPAAAAVASGGADAGMGDVAAVQGGGGAATGSEVGAGAGGDDGGVVGVGRRSGAEAQAEVERLKARQAELFEMIQEEKEVRDRQQRWLRQCCSAKLGGRRGPKRRSALCSVCAVVRCL